MGSERPQPEPEPQSAERSERPQAANRSDTDPTVEETIDKSIEFDGVGQDTRTYAAASNPASPVPAKHVESKPTQPPRKLGRYRVMRSLGSGAFGEVLVAQDELLNRPVAIKIARGHRTALQVEDFLSEARRLAQLQHPSIVAVYDVGEQDGRCFIVTELIEGPNLRSVLQEQRMTWERAANLCAQIAEGLAHAHARGMIHRDIKPSNIMLSQEGRPIILDFGLALTDLEAAGPDGQVVGTPSYMSPEQTRGEAHRVDGRTDIYSLGVMLYELLAGRLPFRATSSRELVRKIAEEEPQPLRQLAQQAPVELADVCRRAMAKRMEDRFTTAGDFAAALRAVLSGQPVAANSAPAADAASPLGQPKKESQRSGSSIRRRREPERRHVTVAIYNFEIASESKAIDAESRHLAAKSFRQIVTEVVAEFRGAIIPSGGQELTASFGYPAALEDAAQRAIRAALRVKTRVPQDLGNLLNRQDVKTEVWAVVSSGEVVVEDLGEDSGQGFSLLGDARNIATRLETTVEPDTVTVTAATYQLAKEFFEWTALGPKNVRGVSEPVELYAVIRDVGTVSRVELIDPGNLTPLVGRTTELNILRDRWEQALEGLGQVVLLIGDAGLGKSRLIREIREHVAAGEGEATIIELRCSPYHQNTGFHPIVEHFGKSLGFEAETSAGRRVDRLIRYLNDLRMDDSETVSLILGLLSLPHTDRYPALTVSPQRIKERTEETLLEWLRRLAKRSPLLFVVEDLHWVDPSALDFLGRYVKEFESGQVLTLLTFRPEFQTPWRSLAHQTQIALNRLTKRQIREMIRSRVGQKVLPERVFDHVIERTDGVPLFVEEFTKLIESSDLLNGEQSVSESVVLSSIPTTLQDLLVARLERLDCDPRVVQTAATVGREFSYRLLRAACEVDEAELLSELDKLVTAEVLFQKGRPPEAEYIFKHALIQDSAYHSMLTKRRQEFHLRIARALEETLPESVETQPELLAQHFTEGGEIVKGIGYWQKAGQHAQGQSAHMEAIHHLERGLGLIRDLPATPDRSGMELGFQLSLGVSLMAAYGYANPRVEQSLGRAGALCDEVGPSAPRFPVMWGTWAWRLIRDDLEQARAVSNHLIELAEAAGDPGLRAEAHLTSACTGTWTGEWEWALRSAVKSLEHFDLETSRQHMAYSGQNVGVMASQYRVMNSWYLGRPQEAAAAHVDGNAVTERVGHPFSTTCYRWHIALLYAIAHDPATARVEMEAGLAIAEQQGFPFWIGMHDMVRGAILQLEGRPDEACQALQKGIDGVRATGAEVTIPGFQVFLADALRDSGRVDESWKTIEDGMDRIARRGGRFAEVDLLLAKSRLMTDDLPAAEAVIQQAVDSARTFGAPILELRAVVALARLRAARGDSGTRESVAAALAAIPAGVEAQDICEARQFLGSGVP